MPDTEHQGAEATARRLVERAPVAALLLATDGEAVAVNTRWTTLTGQPVGDSAGAGWQQMVDREGRAAFVAALADGHNEHAGRRGRLRLIDAEGRFRWTEVLATPLEGAGTIVTFTDVTAERTEARRGQELTRLLEASADLVAVLDSTGQQLTWGNETAHRLLGDSPTAIVDHLAEWSQARYLTTALPAVQSLGSWHGELVVVHDGTEHPLSVLLASHPDEQGVVEALSMVGRDLGELRRAERRVQAGEARLAAMVENATDLVCVTDTEGRLIYASPAVGRALGIDPDGLAGVSVLDLVHDDDLQRAERALAEVVTQPAGTVDTELRVSADGETWRHLDVVLTNLTDNPAVEGLVVNARDITERVAATRTLAQQAYHDDLTGLPNRARLRHEIEDRLARIRENDRLLGVLFLDLDRFKVVNDSLGHAAGDELLRVIAHRLTQAVRPRDLVGRLGGDEFVVVLDDMVDRTDALVTAQRLRRAVSRPVDLAGASTTVSTSVGIAIADDQTSADELLRDSDTALYRAKDQGRDRAEVFEDKLRHRAVRRLHTEQVLRRALDGHSLHGSGLAVHYQPIVDLRDGAVVGAEALVRVSDGDQPVDAGHLVGVAEDSGLITRLGQHVLCDTAAALARLTGTRGDPLLMSVNVSARQLGAPRFARSVARVLDEAGMTGDRLTLELTETTLLGAHPTAEATLHRLADSGVRLALDDFGTGFSSLSHLRRLPIDEVKIDQSFVAGLRRDPAERSDDAAIVSATIALAHELDLTVVAEG
ncbi:MAG: EAL domain-containing protein, partial [Acidimicrobiia bacterium]|nr:EAL domain-containing protein [Acidimicrobiia bacterium]